VARYFAQSVEGMPRRVSVICRWAWRKVEERLFEEYFRRWGLDTKGPDFDHQFDGTSDFVGYVPSPWRVLRTLWPAVGLAADDVLLEYGSGKGRVAIWVASRYPLRRIIGVEHNRDSIAAAQANLRNWRRPLRCQAVEFTYGEATEFVVPDDVTVVYLFNPFVGVTFNQVLAHLRASLARRPRPLRVIYLYPFMHDEVVEAGFTVVRSHEDVFYPWTVYAIG
jgi:predicted RNA methylase